MTNKLILFLTAGIITTLSAFQCKKTDDTNKCLNYSTSPVTNVTGGNTAAVNQDINLTVSFTCNNGCGQFSSFAQVKAGNTTEISVTAKYEGCVCTTDIPVRQQVYVFRAAQAGTYQLKFWQQNNTYITHTVTVQ